MPSRRNFTLSETTASQSKELISSLVQTLPFSTHSGFLWGYKRQGYHDYTFGARILTTHHFYFLCHEIAHAIEFGPELYAKNGYCGAFRFKTNTFWLINQSVTEQKTFQASLREARATAIQARLMEMAGFDVVLSDIEADAFELTQYMPDWYYADKNREQFKQAFFSSYEKHTPDVINQRMIGWLTRSERSRKRQLAKQAMTPSLA